MKITIEKSPNQERRFYHVVLVFLKKVVVSQSVNRSKKSTNGPADEVTPNLKTENGTDFHETNGKHTKNHENGIENDQKSNDHQSDDDLEESIDLTDKVRKIYIHLRCKL